MTRSPQTNRIACAYIPEFLFQLALRKLARDFQAPVALVDREDSRAVVMAVDQRAAKHGIYPGLTYATAIGLCPNLHATYTDPQQVNQIHQQLIERLGLFSPAVEPVADLFGAYYLDVSGMTRLEPDLVAWGQRLQNMLLDEENLKATIVIGFTRFGVQTTASSTSGVVFFKSPQSEAEAALGTPLKRLCLPAKPLKELAKLNIRTVGDLKTLPDWEVRARFAEPMFELARKIKEQDSAVRGATFLEPYVAHVDFDHVESDAKRLVAALEQLYIPLLEKMKRHAQGVNAIHIRLNRDNGTTSDEKVQTAKPTLDTTTLADLLCLRLYAIELDEGVTGMAVHLIAGALPDPQGNLHPALIKSDQIILKANRAIARIEAEFGTQRILRAKCSKAHLPEDSFQWEPFDQLRHHKSGQQTSAAMIRRFFDQPRCVPTPERSSFQRILGPYAVSGFWWRDNSVQRNDYFVETRSGKTQWIFYDKNSRQWYTQGLVQ